MSDYSVIPQEAIDSLLANPEKAGGFDSVFGKGRAAEVLASRTPLPEPKVTQEPELSFLGKVWDATGRAVVMVSKKLLTKPWILSSLLISGCPRKQMN